MYVVVIVLHPILIKCKHKFNESKNMTVMSDIWIREQCEGKVFPMISPYNPDSISSTNGIKHPSYGQSSYGYDVRLGNKFKRFVKPTGAFTSPLFKQPVIDTRTGVPNDLWVDITGDHIDIYPGGCVLGYTEEYVSVPRDVLVICMAKSSIARIFLQACVTPLEPGWEGHVTIELHNPTPYPIRAWAGDGIMQMLFIKGDQPCEISYADRGGKYQNQIAEPVPSKMVE